jgi:hypothetical protein
MADIGATLREARMRQRIDITDMEARTKIRAKYLRALENEEWDLLPGPTYVRSFLRTYAEALDLDGKMVVEEYKLRHDPLETGELHPIRRPNQRERDRQRRRSARSGFPRAAALGLVLAAIVAALYLLGQGGKDNDPEGLASPTGRTTSDDGDGGTGTTTGGKSGSKKGKEGNGSRASEEKGTPKPKTVRLQLVPTGQVYVCLVNASGEVLIGNQLLQSGARTETFRSRRFRVVLGNNNVTLRVNGKARSVPASSGPIGYTITSKGRTDLPESRRPSCGA